MNTPNKLTVLRISLVPFFVWFLLDRRVSFNFFVAEIIFIIACLTDGLDGKLARKRGQVTVFGKFFDPLADKILVLAAFLCFIEMGIISSIPVILILLREFIVTSIRLVAAERGIVISANFWGKLKTCSQMATVIIFISLLNLGNSGIFDNNYIIFIKNLVIWLCVSITLLSGILYIYKNKDLFKDAA
ncbi:MAG: CDP-diacylglycerol--glycerol-3-phosphate 3-phosphatidyltransferase [Oscillospiraceae bacterium]|jgi:CDP-diacylglycerol--glycerol-3-phosphate 3-phosphatidyltransferase|nr:CDP-diacylglycerol--glycerol-3-phosphate 3-phosphatidyltransferase [Oscillospiraceae bacterium]